MPVQRFDDVLDVVGDTVVAAGPLKRDKGETVLVICVKILQDDQLLAECDPRDHPFDLEEGRWRMEADRVENAPEPREGPAIGVAVAVTSGPEDGQMTTYQWIDPVTLRQRQKSA